MSATRTSSGRAIVDVVQGHGSWADVAMNAAFMLLPAVGGAYFRAAKTALNVADSLGDVGKVAKRGSNAADAAQDIGRAGGISPPKPKAAATIHTSGRQHGTAAHWKTIQDEAARMAKSGDYTDVHLNRALSTATEGQVPSRLRPDIVGRRLDGKYDLVEVVSPSQTRGQMEAKIGGMKSLMGPYFGSGWVLP